MIAVNKNHGTPFSAAIALSALGVSLLLVVPVGLAVFPWYLRAASIALASMTLIVLRRWRTSRRWIVLAGAILGLSGQFGVAVVAIAQTDGVVPYRILTVAGLVLYAAIMMALVLRGTGLLGPTLALLVPYALASVVLMGESPVTPTGRSARDFLADLPEWVRTVDPHPILGDAYRPHSRMWSYYPDNPRGYFKGDDRRQDWDFVVEDPAVARLELPDDGATFRIVIPKSTRGPLWEIRLTKDQHSLEGGVRYILSFKARAVSPRPLNVSIVQAHPPWAGLGFFENIDLSAGWRTFRRSFVAAATDDNVQVQFNMNGHGSSLELSEIALYDVSGLKEGVWRALVSDPSQALTNARLVDSDPGTSRFLIDYRLNALGCRDRDYPSQRSAEGVRILLLGDSFTLGAGVREEDTFARQLEPMLNQGRPTRGGAGPAEVINCGVGGYDTRRVRQFYELSAQAYAPDIVLFGMSVDDDVHFMVDIWARYQLQPQPDDAPPLFHLWALVQHHQRQQRHLYPFANPRRGAEEIRLLNKRLRAEGRRLGVVLLPSGPRDVWARFAETARAELNAIGVPVLDLREAFGDQQAFQALQVYPTDPHLNEIAHGIAARRILAFLREQSWVRP